LLVDAADGQLVVALDGERDARGRVDRDGVRVAEGELDRAALRLDAVTGTHDLEALGVALGDADDLVRDERAGQSVERPRFALVVRTGDEHLAVLELDLDGLLDGERELTLRALDCDGLAVDLHLDARWDVDGESADT
jgi:hypothetical protein